MKLPGCAAKKKQNAVPLSKHTLYKKREKRNTQQKKTSALPFIRPHASMMIVGAPDSALLGQERPCIPSCPAPPISA